MKVQRGTRRASWQRNTWNPIDDEKLRNAVCSSSSDHRWKTIAAEVPGRTPKQCRERWKNHLDPAINKTAWQPGEDRVICQFVKERGSKWAALARLLPGRSPVCVKNRYYQHISKLMPGFKLQVPSRSSFKAGKVANGCEGSSADEMDDEEGDVYGEDTSATSGAEDETSRESKKVVERSPRAVNPARSAGSSTASDSSPAALLRPQLPSPGHSHPSESSPESALDKPVQVSLPRVVTKVPTLPSAGLPSPSPSLAARQSFQTSKAGATIQAPGAAAAMPKAGTTTHFTSATHLAWAPRNGISPANSLQQQPASHGVSRPLVNSGMSRVAHPSNIRPKSSRGVSLAGYATSQHSTTRPLQPAQLSSQSSTYGHASALRALQRDVRPSLSHSSYITSLPYYPEQDPGYPHYAVEYGFNPYFRQPVSSQLAASGSLNPAHFVHTTRIPESPLSALASYPSGDSALPSRSMSATKSSYPQPSVHSLVNQPLPSISSMMQPLKAAGSSSVNRMDLNFLLS